jgi:phosphohistidine phosphatase SixA
MKTLFIVRHGEAFWDNPELSDYERPLLKEEINTSKIVANYLC